MVDAAPDQVDFVPPAETEEMELYHPKSWLTKYVFCQDAKVIALQYAFTAIGIGLPRPRVRGGTVGGQSHRR